MEGLVSNEVLRVVGGLVFLFVLAFLWVERAAVNIDIDDYKRAGMALQRGGKETILKVVGEKNDPIRERIRKTLRRDFALIFSYTALLAALGLVLSQANVSGAKWLGLAAVVFILGAAAFDVAENYKTFEILSLDKTSITDSLCRTVFIVSTLKWLLFFLAFGALGVVLIALRNGYSFIGGLMVIGAIVGLAGIFSHKLISPAVLGVGIAVIIFGLFLVAAPQKILRLI